MGGIYGVVKRARHHMSTPPGARGAVSLASAAHGSRTERRWEGRGAARVETRIPQRGLGWVRTPARGGLRRDCVGGGDGDGDGGWIRRRLV
jgi:hypothetical protein